MESTRHITTAGLRADPVSAVSLQVPLQPAAHKRTHRRAQQIWNLYQTVLVSVVFDRCL